MNGPAVFPKSVTEYPLSATTMTHEVAAVSDTLLVVTQQPTSTLMKVRVDAATGAPTASTQHLIGTAASGLHGLCASTAYPGQVWATLQFDSVLLRISPGDDLDAAPTIEQTIPLPEPARGPHVVIEDGDHLWVTLKDSCHLARVAFRESSPTVDVYPAARRPIFVAVHPASGVVYASQDQSSQILALDPATGESSQIAIPATAGTTPVGLIAGNGDVWFVLLGGSAGGTGAFGRIDGRGDVTFFKLPTGFGATASLIHLAWHQAAPDGAPKLWLLGSSISDGTALNAVFEVELQDNAYAPVATQLTYAMPTQMSACHRVLATGNSLYVTEMSTSLLAHIPVGDLGGDLAQSETWDYYANFGLGTGRVRNDYANPFA